MSLKFLYSQPGRHTKVMAIGNGPIIREEINEDGRAIDDQASITEIKEDFITIKKNKLAEIPKSAHNAKVMATLVGHGLFSCLGTETEDYMKSYLKVEVEKDDGKLSKFEEAVKESGSDVSKWHHATIKAVAKEVGTKAETKEDLIEEIQGLIPKED